MKVLALIFFKEIFTQRFYLHSLFLFTSFPLLQGKWAVDNEVENPSPPTKKEKEKEMKNN